MDRKLPRAPAVLEKMEKWTLDSPGEDVKSRWASENYVSAGERPEVIERPLEEDMSSGAMVAITLDNALANYGDKLMFAASPRPARGRAGPTSGE